MPEHTHTDEHRDDIGSRFGMWLFIFTELLLFAGLFITYSVFRYKNWQAFHLAAEELDTFIGALNTVILLISSATIATITSRPTARTLCGQCANRSARTPFLSDILPPSFKPVRPSMRRMRCMGVSG